MTKLREENRRNYDDFYSGGGWNWRYFGWYEKRFLITRILSPLNVPSGSKILEIGCGMGYHSFLLHKIGFNVTSVDVSESGISYAKKNYKGPEYHHIDALKLEDILEFESFDLIFIRGMSFYHYELNTTNKHGIDVPSASQYFMRFLKPRGVFILQVKTDFSGYKPGSEEDSVHMNKYEDYINHFEKLGKVILVTDYRCKEIRNSEEAQRTKRGLLHPKGIIIASQKEISSTIMNDLDKF